MVTDVRFLGSSNRLVSCSKDTFVKVWDLDTQHCVQTLVGHRTEVWSFDVHPTEPILITAAADAKLRVWRAVRPGDAVPAAAAPPGAGTFPLILLFVRMLITAQQRNKGSMTRKSSAPSGWQQASLSGKVRSAWCRCGSTTRGGC